MVVNWANQLVGMRELLMAYLNTDLFVDAVLAGRTLLCSDTKWANQLVGMRELLVAYLNTDLCIDAVLAQF